MNLRAGIERTERCVPQIVRSQRGRPHQHDAIFEYARGHLALKDIGHGNLCERLRRTGVVDEQLSDLVGSDEAVAQLDAFDAVGPDHHRESRSSQVMPGARNGQWREEIVAQLDDERHPAQDTIRIASQAEVARRGSGLAENVEVVLRRIGRNEWDAARLRPPAGDGRIFGACKTLHAAFDLARLEPVFERGLAHVEEISEDDRGRGAFDGGREGQIVVGILTAASDEPGQTLVADSEGVDLLGELVDERHLGVFVRLRKRDVEADDPRALARENIDERRDLGARPRPSAFRLEAFLVDRGDDDRRRLPSPPRQKPQIVRLQLDEIEDRRAPDVERHRQDDHDERQRRRINSQPPRPRQPPEPSLKARQHH